MNKLDQLNLLGSALHAVNEPLFIHANVDGEVLEVMAVVRLRSTGSVGTQRVRLSETRQTIAWLAGDFNPDGPEDMDINTFFNHKDETHRHKLGTPDWLVNFLLLGV